MVQKSTTYDFNLTFIFQSKVNMAAPPEKFNVEEHRTIIKFLFLQGKGAKQIHDEMSQTMGDSGPSYATNIGLSIFKLAISVLKVRNPVEGLFLALCLQM